MKHKYKIGLIIGKKYINELCPIDHFDDEPCYALRKLKSNPFDLSYEIIRESEIDKYVENIIQLINQHGKYEIKLKNDPNTAYKLNIETRPEEK